MTAKERAELVVAWMKKQEQENFYLGTLEINLIAEFEAAEREAWNAAIDCVAAVIENVPYANQDAVAIAKESASVARTFKK